MAQMPARGERYRGPEGYVEVVAVDGVQGKVLVQPAGGGGGNLEVPLEEWRHTYVFAPQGQGVNDELSAAARRGYDSRVRGEPPPQAPDGAKETDQVTQEVDHGDERDADEA